MEARQFLAEFAHIANAPGGVASLRELVLQLAISGRLVERDTTFETPVSESVRLAANERRKYEEDLGLRATRFHTRAYPDPYAIPSHWQWVGLQELCLYIQRGKGPRYAETGHVSVISQKCVQWSGFDPRQARCVVDESISGYGAERFLCAGDLLWNSTGTGTAGRAVVYPDVPGRSYVADSHVTVIRLSASISPRYLWCVIASPWIQARIRPTHPDSLVSGTTQQVELATSAVRALPVPCPPVEEQSRIVDKVNELLGLCDQLEAQQRERRKFQNALRHSTLRTVAGAQSPHELRQSWQHLSANFEYLFSEPQDVDDVTAEMKNLAVRGLLAESSATIPDLERIKADCSQLRTRYIDNGLMRRQKLIGMAACDEDYPKHWAVTALDEMAIVIGGVTKGRNLRGKQVINCPYLAVSNVQRGYFKLDSLKSIEIADDELEKYQVQQGDLLITEGGDWDKVGRTAIWRGDIHNCIHQNHVFKARVPSAFVLNEWVELVFNSRVGREYFGGAAKQTTNLASINMTQLRSFPMPIPPLDEQHRILELLDALMNLCSEWRNQLERRRSLGVLLVEASVASLSGIAIQPEGERPVKAPQTELIAPLRLGLAPEINEQAPLATLLARHNGEMSARDLWQRFGSEIDDFYAQLKTEVAHGWIEDPSYVLDPNAPDSAKKYPDGAQVAKMKIKEEA